MNISLYNGRGLITAVHSHNDKKGCHSWEVGGKTIAIQLGREKNIKILPEIVEIIKK